MSLASPEWSDHVIPRYTVHLTRLLKVQSTLDYLHLMESKVYRETVSNKILLATDRLDKFDFE